VRSPTGAFLLFLATAASSLAAGPSVPPPDYSGAAPDQAAGREIIGQFRQALPDQCYYEFSLEIRPRRGDVRSIPGRLWAGHNEQGPVMRLILDPGALDEVRWLIQGGAQPAAWRGAGAAAGQPAGLSEPLFPGVEMTAFDLQMPFLYWPDETLLSVTRFLGRPAYVFRFRPPAAFRAQRPEVSAVQALFDTQYKAPRQTQVIGPAGILTTLTVNDVKPMGDHPAIVKEADVRNEATRDKTRYEVKAAAVGLEFLPSLFTPAELGADVAPPPENLITRF
jgi:hypothetical protein